TPSSGSIYIDRKQLYNFKQMGGRVGFLFQSPEESFFAQNVFDEVIYGFKNYIKKKDPGKEINEVFDMVGLDFEFFKKRNTYQLSLGEKRRVALASMLIFNPELLILDEFTLSLDGEGLRLFKSIISKLKRKKNIIVLISHDLDELFPLVDKIILINEGKILFNGILKELFENVDLLYESGLKPPQSVAMSGLLNKKGHLLPLDILDEKKAASEIAKRCF
ncbi:MAG: ATP-binding cassette domain-containing protein, partial [Actinomycetia bacterium]|nr:ATP-binding cassette domain-containing protein [Actinomycetes bacterium]